MDSQSVHALNMNTAAPGLCPEKRLARAVLESALEDLESTRTIDFASAMTFLASWRCRLMCTLADLPYRDLHNWFTPFTTYTHVTSINLKELL